MASARALLVAAVAVAVVLGTARGASYTVGAPAGSWDLRTNYTRWASGINFRAGDQLVFRYPRAAHNVLEVSRSDYDVCSGAMPLATFATGDDAVPLNAGGVTRYFICGVPGHCDDGGMKLAVRVEAAGAPNAAAAPSPAPVAMARWRLALRVRRGRHRAPAARAPAAAGGPAGVTPSSSAAPAAVQSSLVGISLAALVAFF